nr:DUF2298 domain-containing protein [Thermoanaerobaculales bacterium]
VLAVFAAVAAGVVRLARRWRRLVAGPWAASSILVALLIAWLAPMALRLATLYVKYLRYWQPLVVPAALLAAWWLARLPRRYRRRATLTAAAGTMLWGIGYLWAFVDPHPHGVAARWLQPLVAPGQVVAFESWDETIGLAHATGPVETVTLPTYDLPDDEDKVRRWCAELERADWVVLTSNRVLRTVLANPERFPRTARLYRLLLTGEAGFEVLARSARGPRILGLRWPVQLADESFVNYEFPQVLILRRTAPTPSARLAERVARPLPYLEEVGLAELQRRIERGTPVIPPVPGAGRQAVDAVLWLLVLAALAAAAWVLLLPFLGSWPDAGLGLAVATGWIVPAWLMWIGSELGLWTTGAATASWIVLLVTAAGGLVASRRWPEITATWRRRRRATLTVLAVGLGVGLLFLAVRAGNPAVHWGEKPMDFAFLNAFLRAEAWPTGEPWMAGMPLHYYYFGEVLASFPILAAGCSPGVGYNLMAATIPAIAAFTLAALGLLLAGRRAGSGAIVLPLLVLLTGNLAWPWLLGLAKQHRWFDLWWATSRVIPGFAIDEYPLWTALFADLHGHFIALPVMIATLAWGWMIVHAGQGRWPVAAALAGISAAVLVATNPWDVFVLAGTLGAGAVVVARRPAAAVARLAVAGAISVLAAAPFIVELVAGLSAGAGQRGLFLTDADFAPWWAVLRHFGVFLLPLAALAFVELGRRAWLVLPVAAIGGAAGLIFGSSAAALGLATAALFCTTAASTGDRRERLAWTLGVLATLAVAGCERFTLIDRMNTLFKVYNGVWLLLAAALATLVVRSRGRRRAVLLATWLPLQAGALVNLPLGIAQGWLQPRMASPRPTLDGQAFLRVQDPETWFFARALKGAARPGEVVAEAAGISYSRHTRVAMHTGQPTVVGWEWHLIQRGQPLAEIKMRFADLETLYAGRDAEARRAILDRYGVRWVVLGELERRVYGLEPGTALDAIPGVVELAAADGAVLYRVVEPVEGSPQPAATGGGAPPGFGVVGRLPQAVPVVSWSLDRDADGVVAVLPDGRLVTLDSRLALTGELPWPSGCRPLSVARDGDGTWVLCGGGDLLRLVGRQWRPAGRAPGAERLGAADGLWAWGGGGVWRVVDGGAQAVAPPPVTAAATGAPGVVWSDGSRLSVLRPGETAPTAGPELAAITALAWYGPGLWAIADGELHRSARAELPWRRIAGELGQGTEVVGGPDGVWIVRPDGVVLEAAAPASSPPPWSRPETSSSAVLDQPRGVVVTPEGWIVVADTMNHRLRWYDGDGHWLDDLGVEGTGENAFREPSGLALAPDGRIAVADTWNGRVQVVAPDGSSEVVIEGLFGPRGVLWGRDGSLLVADTGNRRLLRIEPPSWTAEIVAELPAPVVGLAWVGGLVAAATPADGAVALLDPATGEVVRRLVVPAWDVGDQQEGYVVLLPSGELAASAPKYGEIWVLDPAGPTPPRRLHGELPGVTAMALRDDGVLIASLTWDNRLERVSLPR